MAKPTMNVPATAYAGVLVNEKRAVAGDMEAILAALEEAGVMEFLRALLQERKHLTERLVTKLDSEPTKRGLKNGFTLMMALGSIPEGTAEHLTATLNAGLKSAERKEASEDAEKMSIWMLMGMLKNPDVARSIHYLMGFLEGVGKHLGELEKAR